MDKKNVKMCSSLYLILLSFWMPLCVLTESDVGCLFSPSVCENEEECFDDNVFGRCQLPYGSDVDLYRHLLGLETIQLLESELSRLFAGGYRWRHEYTQCVVQNILYSSRHEISYDPGLCSRIMQFTLPEVPPEILSEIEAPEPDELAFIKFKPNHNDPDGDVYADEIFTPPIFSERLVPKEEKKRSSVTDEEEKHWSHNYHTKKYDTHSGKSSLSDKEELLRELLKTAEDTEKLFKGLENNDDSYLENDILRKSDLDSELNERQVYPEDEWQSIEDNEFPEDELFDPLDKKRVQLAGHAAHEIQDPFPVMKIADDNSELLSTQKFKPVAAKDIPTFGRNPSDEEDEDANFRWNRNKFIDDDITRFSNGGGSRVTEISPQNIDAESSDTNNLSDIIENRYVEDQLYAILPADKGLSTFTRDMRYDIKKPGPTYMFHEDGDGDPSEDMAGRGGYSFISHLSKNVVHNQLLSLLKSPVGITKSSKAFVPNFEVTDETSRIFVTSGNDLPEIPKIKPAAPKNENNKIPVQRVTYERPAADQPELLEGINEDSSERDEDKTANAAKTGEGHIGHYDTVAGTHTYLLIKENSFQDESAQNLVETLGKMLNLPKGTFSNMKIDGRQITFKVNPNSLGYNASDVATKAEQHSAQLQKLTGLTVEGAGIGDKVKYQVINPENDKRMFIIAFSLCGAVAGVLLAAGTAYLVRRHSRSREKLQNITHPDTEASQDYQDLCRQRMQSKANEKPEPVHTVHSPKKIRSLSQEGQASSSSHSSTSSWNEEPVTSNMDISTGHMILSYMEDHLKNKDRLDREWEALCAYEAELCATTAASLPPNIKKNRYTDVLPYDHSRVVLNELSNVSGSDYINASSITDHDPRNPAYIATQGPLPQTASDFWQMIWEQGSVVIVMLSRLMENGVAMCHRYWPEEGSEVYHIYEVHLVSEHIWCDDYLVRSFYLKNLRTSETRTVTQFHFMSWPDNGVPNSTKALLEFRRKVNKSYRGRSCPIVVHCSDGIGRTGTYCLIDMVLNRMAKGAKEIDIAATLEHVRDQRTGMVKTKAQFEFVLMAIAEEVHAILKALSQ